MRLSIGTIIPAKGLLFDMDGTLIDSRIAVEHIWQDWCRRHGVDWSYVKANLHGLRLRDSVRRFAPEGVDVVAETDFLYREELTHTDGIVPIPGAIDLLASLPATHWTIVTSADKELARARLGAAGVGEPPLLVGGDDVHHGKPDPQGYIEGARRLGVAPAETLVFEDAAAGIAAGRAAGARVIAVATDHPEEIPADIEWVPDLSALVLDSHDPVSGTVSLRVVA
ncbi:HAD-IA family hydrolase [Frateuria aurantia]|uniref:Haloacid dehalogenase superfamily protein, subfamily IA, variant 3 with third motif having DD or ED n=1 Tax=Frateuria aurantia (strain ATCC 33424 / DSM 6220 / KCTC 2777 / LMG 1558 / NBRC 3245 / NCIMB 13370) TaxID=767434 RepID=H8L013_FRAAD|nr:HAD-IA family hydrolase [Frateuria aurantia]AFC85294.1 haloacid dehalogenase superfamily protein, subfamily IA, variant 3 with third motif having DD or ED [Frateuria aurantia DSM 6220]